MVYDVIVIGSGQAGLAMGYYLKKSSLSFLILDNRDAIGDAWRKRYDSLILFTPRSHSSLPGLPLKGNPDGLPSKDEIADYLECYAKTFDLPIELNTEVKSVTKQGTVFTIETRHSILKARNVVIATGPFHKPNIPSFSNEISKGVVQLHSSQYKNSSQLNEGTVLVVGGGNSGAQIATELSQTHSTYLSVGQNIHFMPLMLFNKSIFWWFDKLGILKASRTSFLGRRIQKKGDPIFGYALKEKIKENNIKIKGRTITVHDNVVSFHDHSSLETHNIIWSTGFISDFSWINIPNIFDSNERVIHNRGITDTDGLFFLGQPWQHRRGSSLLLGVGKDAEYLYQYIMSKRNK